jgi:rubrerythrin
MADTTKNLEAAFAGESQANRKYLAFAKKADAEGKKGIAKLFRAAAAAETVHAHNHFNVLKGVGGTLDNLNAAYDGEHHEFTIMYPEFLEIAKKENNQEAIQSFYWAHEVEKVHGALYQKAIDSLKAGRDITAKSFYVCERCGYTIEDGAPDTCPVCGAGKELFNKVE